MSKETLTRTTFDRYATIFMAVVCAISLLALTGWVIDQPILASLSPKFIPMAPSSGLIFLGICGTWLIQKVLGGRHWIRIFSQISLVGILITVLILATRYFTGLGPDFEQLLVPNPMMFGQTITAHMSPLTALGFFLAIPAFLLITGGEAGKGIRTASASLSLAVLLLSSINLLGYVYGAPPFYGGTLIPVSINSALSFLFLSLGLLMTAGPACWPVSMFTGSSIKARLMRAFLPASILTALIQGFLSTANISWINNPALKVATAALLAFLIVFLIIYILSNRLNAEIELSDRERFQAEKILRQSEMRFRTLAETANDAIININREGHILFWNRAAETIFGYSAGEMTGKPLDRVMPDGFLAAHRQGLERVVLTGETHIIGTTVEVVGLGKDGHEFPLALSLATWQVDGEVFFTGIGRDITERKQAEDALKEGEEKFRNLFSNAGIGMFRTRLDGSEILDVNDKFLSIFGRSREEMGGSASAIHWADPRERKEMVRRLEAEGHVNDFECGMLNKQGEVRRCITSLQLNREQGILEGSILDITERKRNELVQNAIFRITQAALTSEGIDALYRSIHSILGELVPAQNFFIALIDPASNLISFPYYIDQYDEPPTAPTRIQGLTGYVIRTGRPLLATREILDQLVEQGEVEALGTPGVDWMGATLKVEGRIIGVMAVQSYTAGTHFQQEDLTLLEFISSQVAQAIERKRLEEEVRSLSLTDELTGLFNRRGFNLLAEQELKLAQRFKRSVMLFFVDLDDLKMINDSLGHAHGDLALKEVATILKETFREADVSARIGGDEFVVLCPDLSVQNADILTKRLQSTLERRNQQRDQPYQLTLSMGSACYDPEVPCKVGELIAQADDLMYIQKQAQKGNK